MTQGPSD